ncbi:DNA ligase IV [Pelomyxa schiedti]|nr:DNA ligase IV [Pelomyxa schiedti]
MSADDHPSKLSPTTAATTTSSTGTSTSATSSASGSGGFDRCVPFSGVVELLERVYGEPSSTKKKRLVQLFFSHYRDDNFFPLMRILLPQLDRERATYGMKEKNIAKLYVELLGISPTSDDGVRLIHWRKPTSNVEAGDFGNAVFLSLKNRCEITSGKMSLYDLNLYLDQLNTSVTRFIQWSRQDYNPHHEQAGQSCCSKENDTALVGQRTEVDCENNFERKGLKLKT